MTDDHRQIERDATLWLARRDAGGWSDRQQAALDAWLAQATAHRVAFLRLEASWEQAARLKILSAGATHDGIPARGAWLDSPYFAPLASDALAAAPAPVRGIRRRPRARHWPVLAAVAASLLAVVIAMGSLAWRDATHVDRGEWRTTLGAQQVVQLADGSTATLGSNTRLRVELSRRERDLYLPQGEAFFDVAHDPARPFVVHAAGYRVTAVGTRFDVCRDDSGKLRVVVTRGLVRLQSARDPAQAPAMLPAGSIATVDGGDVLVRNVSPDEARERLSWRNGYAVFHGTPLAEAVEEFNRYNTRKIVIADPSLDALRVGGNFRLDNSAAFVRLVQEVFPVRVAQGSDRIVLTRRAGTKYAR
ncbi:MAG: Iron siderophore sensor protein [Rhodanobacteraceae bacterium]|jgi:transmembrane sensor|nr:MAG: Iron siderophore sensor protein [Rhodanobacteraceae bacterium]